ncbi:SUMF1/EgtB/PvdO family nonheme iron enzyme [Myxococcota bacterium]|nr:SUMF1/EgtB/PvdO family nonheme iron enzyme [Myxococcota bacterium]
MRVLHLSDLHFSAKTAWDSDTVLGRLAADVASLRAELGELHLVVVTGDIANHGTAEEYERATAWLTKQLAQAAGVTSAQIRVVPGNHDVYRASITRTAKALTNDLLSDPDPQQAIAEVLSDPNERAPLLARQTAYLSFAQTFHPGLTVPWWSERLPDLQGLTVHLAGFNSAWLSSDDTDLGRLLVSRWQCHQLLASAEGADLSIALLHHPWSYLQEQDQGVVEEEIRRRCGVILHGHLHQQKARIASDPDRDVLQLAAGASYAGSKWANAYQLLELDPKRGEARVHFRLWDGFDWIPDRNRYQKAPASVATLPLRRSPRAPAPRAMTPAELALSALFSEEFTTPALNAWLSADPRRAPARSALTQAGEDPHDRLDLLAVTLTQLGLVDETLFVSLVHERPTSAQAVAEAARVCGVTLSVKVQALALEAPPADTLTRYSRLELVMMLEELQIRRDRARRSKHELDDLNEQINAVARRLASALPPRVGAVVAGATLEARVARGAFGAVWRGRAPDGQTVAVKVFHPEQLTTNMAVWGFRRGVRAMQTFARRRAPGSLARVLSVAEDELAFTMPFITGATLEETDLSRWTLSQRLDCFQAICEAIQFAHDVQVIHRDLKPANIMIDGAGAPVVIDFDAADVGHATLLSMAIQIGTLEYMAPEQPRAARASVLMDVYSLGRVLQYLLRGEHPDSISSDATIVRSELRTAPPALVELVLRATSPTPEARPTSVSELLRELGEARAALTVVESEAPMVVDPAVKPRPTNLRRPKPPVTAPTREPPEPVEAPIAARAPQMPASDATRDAQTAQAPPLPPPPPAAPPLAPPAAPSAPVVSQPVAEARPPQPPQPSAPPLAPPAPSSAPVISARAAEAPPPQPPPQPEVPLSSASVAEAIPDFTSSTSGFVAVEPVEPERASPSWGWRGLGALVVVLGVVGAWVKFGEEEAAPVEPVTEATPVKLAAAVAPTPVIGPCELPALGGPTGETHKPQVAGLDMPFVGLSAGQFCMGSAEGVGDDDEHPQHPVKVAGCLMGKSEVTQAQWRAVVKAAKATKDVDAAGLNEDPSDFKGDKLPVENVSWCDVVRFANALSRLDGRAPVYEVTDGCAVRWIDGADGYRLPTEAEWEYAARAGTTTAYATGDDEAALALAGWYDAFTTDGGNSGGKTHDVCTAPKQPWGLCDLHGNVWEWVFDAYDSGTYARRAAASTFDGSATLAETASGGALRVLRGGSWDDGPGGARSADRSWGEPSFTFGHLGFRLLLCPPERP